MEQAPQKSKLELALDREEMQEAQRKLRQYRSIRNAGWIIAAVSAVLLLTAFFLTTKFHNDLLEVSAAAPAEEREASYIRSLKLAPREPDAYIALLNLYSEDGIFSTQESEKFLGLYNKYQARLSRRNADYANLHYSAAFLYLNGYDGTSPTRLRMALPFLDKAMEAIDPADENYAAVNCYSKIANYYRTYIWDASAGVREVTEQQMQELMTEIINTLVEFDTNTVNLYNRLGFYEAVCNLLYDQRDILAVTVKETAVTVILDTIYNNLPDASSIQKEQTKQVLNNLLTNEETYRDMIHRAFERSVPQ